MKRFALIVLPLLLVLALGTAACGKTTTGGSGGCSGGTLQLTTDNFAATCANINAGQAITFADPTNGGGIHILCIGKDEQCSGTAGPPALSKDNPLTINPGETKPVTFPTAGDFAVTCTVHTNMNMVVHVK